MLYAHRVRVDKVKIFILQSSYTNRLKKSLVKATWIYIKKERGGYAARSELNSTVINNAVYYKEIAQNITKRSRGMLQRSHAVVTKKYYAI